MHPDRFRYSDPPFVFDEINLIWMGKREGGGGGGEQNGHLRVFAEYLKNGSADFHQTYVTFLVIIYGSIFGNEKL